MHANKAHHYAASRLLWLALAALLMRPIGVVGAAEDTFGVLQIGAGTNMNMYTNVTVMTKASNYIFIVHSGGMASVKLAELQPEVRKRLGYADASASQVVTNTAAGRVKQAIAKFDVPRFKEFRKRLEQDWRRQTVAKLDVMGLMGPKRNWTVLGIVLLLYVCIYLFYSYCCLLICRKAGHPPGVLIWLPLLKLLPMLRAAGMSCWWLVACFVPLLNLVPLVLWPLKIAKARGKSVWIGVLLLLPVANVFAFLYLAFSDSAAEGEDEGPQPKVMSLQAV
jgi:hypothetical protein